MSDERMNISLRIWLIIQFAFWANWKKSNQPCFSTVMSEPKRANQHQFENMANKPIRPKGELEYTKYSFFAMQKMEIIQTSFEMIFNKPIRPKGELEYIKYSFFAMQKMEIV